MVNRLTPAGTNLNLERLIQPAGPVLKFFRECPIERLVRFEDQTRRGGEVIIKRFYEGRFTDLYTDSRMLSTKMKYKEVKKNVSGN